MISRRSFFKWFGGLTLLGAASGAYAGIVEPVLRLNVTRWDVSPKDWPKDLKLRIAVITDLHACRPWMTPSRIRRICAKANDLDADIILLAGDYVAGHRFVTNWVHSTEWAPALGTLKAPHGVFAVLGNHDWWEDKTAQKNGHGPTFGRLALEKAGIPVLENDAVRVEKDGKPFWIAGLADQLALLPKKGRRRRWGLHDLPGTLAQITDDAPVVLLAHEPDIFPKVPERVSLTISGHTHGGQVRLFGYAPIVPSIYGNRYAYGHIVEDDRHLVVSGGLGCSILPVRVGMPPEITVIDLA